MLQELIKELKKKSNPTRARLLQKYFKTGEGEYGAGDIFIGLTVPELRKIALTYHNLSLSDIQKLLKSAIHEYRMTTLEILVFQYERAIKTRDEKIQEKIYNFYLKNTKYINNWDLVDTSCSHIVGHYCFKNNTPQIIFKLARSKNIWERRIAIISTFYFIKQQKYKITLDISKLLLTDSHDLIHKAVGWALREVGNKSQETEEKFLRRYYKTMPRTMLRYAIEKFPKEKRNFYMKK